MSQELANRCTEAISKGETQLLVLGETVKEAKTATTEDYHSAEESKTRNANYLKKVDGYL